MKAHHSLRRSMDIGPINRSWVLLVAASENNGQFHQAVQYGDSENTVTESYQEITNRNQHMASQKCGSTQRLEREISSARTTKGSPHPPHRLSKKSPKQKIMRSGY